MSSLNMTHLPDADYRLLLDTGTMKLSTGLPRNNGTHILLADRQPKVRFALRVLLERQPDVVIVGEAINVEDLISQTRAKRPDLVLLDWDLPGLMASGYLPSLRKINPEMSVIALSGHAEARQGALAPVSMISPVKLIPQNGCWPKSKNARGDVCERWITPCKLDRYLSPFVAKPPIVIHDHALLTS